MNENTPNNANPESADTTAADTEAKFDRLDELLSSILDDNITDAQVHELGQMLENDPAARERYVQGMQLHADLMTHFQPERAKFNPLASPVLGMLDSSDSGIIMPPSIAGETPE